MTKVVKEFNNLADLVDWVGENWDDIQKYKEFAGQENMVEFTMRYGTKIVAVI